MDSATQLNNLKKQAELNAFKKLQIQFSTNDQLEQIDKHLNKYGKLKTRTENKLKAAIASHFLSVATCMQQLNEVDENLTVVRSAIYSIQEEYQTISHLENTLGELRKEANRHKQLKSAKENVKNILNVSDLSKQAKEFIESNKLLDAHKCLLDMEKCRNEILEELEKPEEKNASNFSDKKLVEDFFKEIKEIQTALKNYIFLTIKRMIEVSKSYPEKLVTALRIIEREELLDEEWQKKKDETGFAPKDRPKRWRQTCQNTIRQIIENKIHGLRIEERETDESWFSKHLGNVTACIVPDVAVVKKLCAPCFPPTFRVFDYFIRVIHEILSEYFKNLIDSNQLKGQEFYILLSWLNTYRSEYFMGYPPLEIDVSKLPPLLEDSYFERALFEHTEFSKKRITSWFQNTLEKNVTDWTECIEPTLIEGNFESSLTNDLNTMIVQQIELVIHVNDERFSKETLKYLINQLNVFVDMLKEKIVEFKVNHFKNTSILKNNFLVRQITISNDCLRLKECLLNIRNKYDKFMDKDEVGGPNDLYENLGVKISQVSSLCLDVIIEDMFTCLDDQYFKVLLSKEWLTNDNIVNTIIETSNDYMADLTHLRPESLNEVLFKWHNRIKVEYMKGFFQNLSTVLRKCQFADSEERKLFGTKMNREILYYEKWFKSMILNIGSNASFDFSILTLMTKIIRTEDVDYIGVEIGALIKKCPDLTAEMLFALLSLRGDITKNDFRDKYEGYIVNSEKSSENNKAKLVTIAQKEKDNKTDPAIKILKRELKL